MKKQASSKKPSDNGKSKPKKSPLAPKRDHDEEQMNKYRKQHLYNEDDDDEAASDDEPIADDLDNLDFDYDDDDDDDY